jgi:DNA invertase Pin-like site-specific DNA recombinase
MIIGYMRPYPEDSSCEHQYKLLSSISCDKTVVESSKDIHDKYDLMSILENLKSGDILVISELFIIAESLKTLYFKLNIIKTAGAKLISVKENIDSEKKIDKNFFEILSLFVEFQSEARSENTKFGIMAAKEKGKSPGRPKKSDKNISLAIEMYNSHKYTLEQIKSKTGISKSTLYRYL